MSKQLTYLDIYKTLWKCRDFELQTLWQRSIMLGTFLAITYTGYGVLVINAIESNISQKWELFNLLAIFLCAFGAFFSTLWILILKGSKNWTERIEAAIDSFAATMPDNQFQSPGLKQYAGFGAFFSEKTGKLASENYTTDDSLLTNNAGPYSVSRVAITIGIVSLCGWILLALAHISMISLGYNFARHIFTSYAFHMAFFTFVAMLILCFITIKDSVRSSCL